MEGGSHPPPARWRLLGLPPGRVPPGKATTLSVKRAAAPEPPFDGFGNATTIADLAFRFGLVGTTSNVPWI